MHRIIKKFIAHPELFAITVWLILAFVAIGTATALKDYLRVIDQMTVTCIEESGVPSECRIKAKARAVLGYKR
jgi:hypothetical protein